RILWEERQVVSVANLTRADAHEFLDVAPKAGVKTQVVRYPLADANTALDDLRGGRLQGAAVLIPGRGILVRSAFFRLALFCRFAKSRRRLAAFRKRVTRKARRFHCL